MKIVGNVSGSSGKISPNVSNMIRDYEASRKNEPTFEPVPDDYTFSNSEPKEKFDKNELGGAVGEKIRQEIIPNLGDLGGAMGQMFGRGSNKPPVEFTPTPYTPSAYVGIFDTYEPLPKNSKLDYQPIGFEEFKYEPYVHEKSNYESRPYEPLYGSQQEIEFDGEVTKETGIGKQLFGFGEQNKPWENSPVFTTSGMGNNLFGAKSENPEPLTGSLWASSPLFGEIGNKSPIFDKTGLGEQLFGAVKEEIPSQDTGKASELVGDTNPDYVFKPTGMGEVLLGTQREELPIQSIPEPIVVPEPIPVTSLATQQVSMVANRPLKKTSKYKSGYIPPSRLKNTEPSLTTQ